MKDFDAIGTITNTIRDNSELIYNVTQVEAQGVGGLGGDYQTITTAYYPAATLTAGVFISRVISNYDPATDTKTGIETEFGIGGWPLAAPVFELNSSGSFTVLSAQNLSVSTVYTSLHFWISDAYYQRIFIDGTHGLSDAINDTVGDGGLTIWPAGEAVVASNDLSVSGTTSPATSIFFNGSVVAGAAAGTVVGKASANRSNGAFLEGTPALSWVTVGADGTLRVTAGQSAPAAGNYSIQLVYDNSGIQGGGTYAQTVPVAVAEATSGTARFLPVPPVNANASGKNLNIAQLSGLLDSLKSDWAGSCASLGIASSGVDVVLELASGSLGKIALSNKGPFSDGNAARRVHIRGQGAFSRNAWQPTAGTRLGAIDWDNCRGLRLWLVSATSTSFVDTGPAAHAITNSSDFEINRCHLAGDVAESASAAAVEPSIAGGVWLNGSSNGAFRQCTYMGFGKKVFYGAAGLVANDITISGMITDQLGGADIFNFGNSQADNWLVEDVFAPGWFRAPSESHRDFFQGQSGGVCRNWTLRGIWKMLAGHWGVKRNVNFKIAQMNNSATVSDWTLYDCFITDGGNGITGALRNSAATYCAQFFPPDMLQAEKQDGSAKIWAKGSDLRTDSCNPNDSHICTGIGLSRSAVVGPNGVFIENDGFIAADTDGILGTWDFSEYANWFENYQTSSAANARNAHVPRQTHGVGGWKAKAGSRLHWDHPDPVGPYQLQERMFDTVTHDNPWDWGWPCCALFAIRYDSEELCGGAGANASGTAFDANGN